LIIKDTNVQKIDFFDVGLKIIRLEWCAYNIYLWGIGDIEKYKLNEKYSLSFPLHGSLLDRNVLIKFERDSIVIENDWLGSIPVFYNPKENIISTLSNFCLRDRVIDNEGLSNFCEFGYSVLEQTMFKDVKFMRYYSRLIISNGIKVESKKDPVLDVSFLEKISSEGEAIKLMQEYISNAESKIDGDIVLPTSGGYDSRILNYFVKDKKRIRSFTYGISKDQSKSDEVVNARKISEIYGTEWEQIELKEYHKYMDKWLDVYGFSAHTHGMYHIEFYKNISKKYDFSNASFLSGIIGDAWAELGKFNDIKNHKDIINLGYTHGMHLDLEHLKLKSNNQLKKDYFIINGSLLGNDKIKSIFAMRTKLMLISYLTQIPEYFGMPVWTPFLNFEIVKTTLNMPDDRRNNRAWQKDFFKQVGLNIEDMNLQSVKANKLDYEIGRNAKLEIIDILLMKTYIEEDRLIEINKLITKISLVEKIINKLLYLRNIGRVLRFLGFKNKFLNALYEYYVIKAIEKGLKYGG